MCMKYTWEVGNRKSIKTLSLCGATHTNAGFCGSLHGSFEGIIAGIEGLCPGTVDDAPFKQTEGEQHTGQL